MTNVILARGAAGFACKASPNGLLASASVSAADRVVNDNSFRDVDAVVYIIGDVVVDVVRRGGRQLVESGLHLLQLSLQVRHGDLWTLACFPVPAETGLMVEGCIARRTCVSVLSTARRLSGQVLSEVITARKFFVTRFAVTDHVVVLFLLGTLYIESRQHSIYNLKMLKDFKSKKTCPGSSDDDSILDLKMLKYKQKK